MGDCMGTTSITVTNDILDRYPQLRDEGIEVGDRVSIGMAPFDGVVNGPMKKVGTCENSCRIRRATIDGNAPLTWQSEFVAEFFPDELKKLEDVKKDIPIPQCYRDSLVEFAASQIMMNIRLDDDGRKTVERFTRGMANMNDLKYLEGSLKEVLKIAEGERENTIPIMFALKLVQKEIKTKRTAVK